MAEDDDQESKTEEPTGRKLSQAREQGNVIQSQEVKTAVMLLGILVVVWLIAPFTMAQIKPMMASLLEHSYLLHADTEGELSLLSFEILSRIGLFLLLPLGFLMLVGFLSSVGQTGWLLTLSKIQPDLNKLNPIAGLQRMFSSRTVVELLKSTAKLILVGTIVTTIMMPQMKQLELLPSMEIPAIMGYLHHILIKLIFVIVLCVVVIAAADYFYQRFTFLKKMRMTKQEVKDEGKQTEGDPLIKSRMRSLRLQRARQRMMANVPKADVVVTNPTHYACALKYDQETMTAPMMVAKGKNLVALRIRELAQEHDVPIVENPPLARALFATVDLDREVPPEHYKAVAEVISYVMRLKGKFRR